jgi:hypothetical protein
MRRDDTRRITPELMAYHKRRARELRTEAYRSMTRAVWPWLIENLRRRLPWLDG